MKRPQVSKMNLWIKIISSMIAVAGLLLAYPLSANALITVVADYHLGEADPGAAAGNPGDATTIDSSGNGNNLTRIGTAETYSSDVATSAALHTGSTLSMGGFTRSTAYYQKATVDTAATDNFGIEAWFKLTSTPPPVSNEFVAYNGDPNTGSPNNGFGIIASDSLDGNIAGYLGGQGFLDTGITPVVNTWYYVAYVIDNGTSKIYVDSITPSYTLGGTSAITPSGPFTIGANDPAGDGGFTGLIDEVRVFTFAPGGGVFSTNDLLISQTAPEPASLGLLLLATPLLTRRCGGGSGAAHLSGPHQG